MKQHTATSPVFRTTPQPALRHMPSILQHPAVVVCIALAAGALVGGLAALSPLYALAGMVALATTYVLLTNVLVGIVLACGIITLLPFGTLPFKAIITPNLLELTLAGVMGVWILRLLAHSDAYDMRFSSLGVPIMAFLGITFFSLILGANGLPDSLTLHNYLKFILGVLLYFSMVNVIRTHAHARYILRGIIISGGIAAGIGLLLYILNDETALRVLVTLGRVGYPTSGRVLRYVEDDPDGMERAIGFAVDPNSYGGMLALVMALAAAQLFATRPVLPRGVLAAISSLLFVVLLLTFSRAALIGVIAAALYLATVRYRRLWWVMIVGGICALLLFAGLGMAEGFVQRFTDGLQFQDQAQQMRLAEYHNAIAIIQRYPLFGIGFGKAPEIDLVAGVSSIYLTIGERMGLLGLGAFVAIVGSWFVITWQSLRTYMPHDERTSWVLGAQSGIVAALAVGLADHYFFNIEFSHMVALFWGCLGLGISILTLPAQEIGICPPA